MDTLLVKHLDSLEELAESWNRAPSSRGEQADPYDSHAWLSAWLEADRGAAEDFLCPAVVDEDGLLAALPLVARHGIWRPAGSLWRPRYRVICRGTEPRSEVLDRLVEGALRAKVRHLELAAMPSRDPATAMLRQAFERAGCRVLERRASSECLAPVEEGWEAHRRRFRKYERTVKNFSNKAARLGPLTFREEIGSARNVPEEGWEVYTRLHGLGWKGPLREPMRTHRRALFDRMASLGWLRVFSLRVAGVASAAIVWLRVGSVAVAYSTVYDVRLAALSAGTIAMWRSHEELVREQEVALFDYLPGRGPQKDQLTLDRAPLTNLVVSRSPWIWLGLDRWRGGARTVLRRLRRSGDRRGQSEPEGREEALTGSFEPGAGPGGLSAAPLELRSEVELYLTVAGGHPSPKRMKQGWCEGDEWWRLGEPLKGLVRLGAGASQQGPRPAREVVLASEDARPEELLCGLAAHLQTTLDTRAREGASGPIPVLRAPLPWPEAADDLKR